MPGSSLQFVSAAAAFRADNARDGVPRPAATRESAWIAVTTLLEHASLAADDSAPLVARAVDIARDTLGAGWIQRRGDREWRDERWPGDAILLLADDGYEADAFNTSLSMLTALDRADARLSPVQRGRLLARRARILARLGRLEHARDHFLDLGRLGKRIGSAELRARAWLGLASIAQMRGNYAAMEALDRRAARLAGREGLSFIERFAHLGLTVAAVKRRDFDDAIVHGWAVYRASLGWPVDEGESLQTFGQVMLEAHCFAEARAALAAVVSRALPARIIVPALGGLALSAAETGRAATVRWVANQLRMIAETGVARFVLSTALLECSVALKRIGQEATSAALREQATTIAAEHGFHEVLAGAAEIDSDAGERTRSVFIPRGRALRIVAEVASMEPGRLPTEVSLLAVPA